MPQGPDYVLDKSDLEDVNNGRRIKCDLMVLWGERGIVGKFWDPKREWRKFCVGEVVGRAVDTGHYIPEGGFTIVAGWMALKYHRNGYQGVGGRDFRLFQGVGAALLKLGWVLAPTQNSVSSSPSIGNSISIRLTHRVAFSRKWCSKRFVPFQFDRTENAVV
jgi:hypothetical protein